jgi:hypothetical protein
MRKLLLAALAMGLAAGPATAWNKQGHMMVAAAAWEQLSDTSKARASALLRHNPDYESWIAGVPDAQRDKTAFMRAAAWPDDIRSNSRYLDDGITPPAGPKASRNIGYDDCLLHRYWHFKDLAFSPDHTRLEPPPAPNAETQIKAFAAALGDASLDDNVKGYDLAWLIHLVGDVHQPLHGTARFTRATPHGDAGGNTVTICNPGCGKKLHSYWDGTLGASDEPGDAIAAAADLPAARPTAAAILTPAVWLTESRRLAKSTVYRAPIGVGNGPFHLTPAYEERARSTAQERAALAAARLANLIDGANIQVAGMAPRPQSCRH